MPLRQPTAPERGFCPVTKHACRRLPPARPGSSAYITQDGDGKHMDGQDAAKNSAGVQASAAPPHPARRAPQTVRTGQGWGSCRFSPPPPHRSRGEPAGVSDPPHGVHGVIRGRKGRNMSCERSMHSPHTPAAGRLGPGVSVPSKHLPAGPRSSRAAFLRKTRALSLELNPRLSPRLRHPPGLTDTPRGQTAGETSTCRTLCTCTTRRLLKGNKTDSLCPAASSGALETLSGPVLVPALRGAHSSDPASPSWAEASAQGPGATPYFQNRHPVTLGASPSEPPHLTQPVLKFN